MVIIEIIKNQHKKTKAVLFLPKTKRVFNPASLYLNGSVIDYVDYFKSLGVTFSSTMSWDAHVSNISSTLARIVRISSPNRHILPTKTKVTLYDILFFSHLSYCFLVWGDTTVTNVLKLLPRILNPSSAPCVSSSRTSGGNGNTITRGLNVFHKRGVTDPPRKSSISSDTRDLSF